MPAKSNESDLKSLAKKLSEYVESTFEQLCKTSFIGEPEIIVKDIIEYKTRMRLFGLEKFNGPCYISAVNLYLNDNELKKDHALGAVILYIEESVASGLLKATGQKGIDCEDFDSITNYTGEFCSNIVSQFKNHLISSGYTNIVMSAPSNHQDDIPLGVNFKFSENKYCELSFVLKKEPAIKVDFTIGPAK
ncbi:MAG: hypothetical protein A2Y03_05480 [Omnitrophica WOR_2 bacterium GWF2_38_59]|nr:MAG: hypothetical protein A2Y06_07275 [Omnitrophica WOR_2 bacterium GWA2_37_7]OGX23032.1 MAG: hypothetical protein A2Y03_05480 [Omnitrophica WOR_2 bacterium GWF2_38_59]OGX51228.1 MAG: hypothetical protein A2243_05265 [Omnitrophica WOR_2 bacterium RIFOXYA2_FULL_38_17]OGX54807.1 MAG: hypothetical protein A2267_06155 [Omnitrophica WOR_2 bacterium RIFOXYA12_FULL_38_10]OGX55349.1 MAG: hypothetical protein A2306_06615 [Omnitrophica WOR_2 bacterium RIFOXYB2_FULL_38_16]OGX57938.1 MAG: hypothetical 